MIRRFVWPDRALATSSVVVPILMKSEALSGICRATIWDILNNPEKWSGAEASQFLGQLNYFMQIENEYFSNLIQRYTEKTGKDIIEVLIDRIKNDK